MKILRYLLAVIGILHHVETKAFQSNKDNLKGAYDHMYENLYLKKAADKNGGQSYEMRYVPHVDGKPIFIPFDEFETLTPPSTLKPRPIQLKYKPHIENTKIHNDPIHQKTSSPYIPKKNNEYKEMHADKPIVIDVVTKAVSNTQNFKSVLKNENKYVPGKKQTNVKEALRHSDHMNGVKENIASYHAVDGYEKSSKEKISSSNYDDSPVVVESVTEKHDYPVVVKPITEKHEESVVGKTDVIKMHKRPSVKEISPETDKIKETLYSDTKIPEKIKSEYKLTMYKHKKTVDHKDYDLPVIVENSVKETTEDYDLPIVIRPLSEKHMIGEKADVVKINKPVVKDSLKNNEMKPGLYVDTNTKIPEKKTIKSNYEFSNDPVNFVSDISISQTKNNSEKLTNNLQKYENWSKFKDLSTETLSEVDTSKSEVNPSMDSFNQDSDYYEEYGDDLEYEDYDSPVVVDALVQKADQRSADGAKETTGIDYDTPVVVEALLKKTENIDSYDKPIVSEALTMKHPIKNAIEKETKYSSKNKDSDNSNYETPIVVEALVKKTPLKHNKKRIKYSTKMKPIKSSTHSLYEDSSNKQISENVNSFHFEEKSTISSNNKAFENKIVTNPSSLEEINVENFLTEGSLDLDILGDVNDQFDAGSGIINERSISSDDLEGLSAKSNAWPLLMNFHSQERNKFKKCTTPTDEPGNCMPIQMCPTPNLQLTLDDLLKKICTIDEVFIGICCPEFPAETLKVDWENFVNDSSNEQEALESVPEGCGKIQEFGKDPQSWPWMAPLISVSTRRIFCGGVLIKKRYVLTAAHCTRKIPRNQIVVVLGPSEKDSTPQEFEVVEIKRHAQYNPRTMQNDIALLKLSRKVRRPFICLPENGETFVGKEALMLGWQGSFAASKTEEKLLVISPQECRKAATKIVVGDNIMCTELRTEDVMCNVDSGAPLVFKSNGKYQVIGILTWNRNDCDSFPSIFTRVSHFKGWIENHAV